MNTKIILIGAAAVVVAGALAYTQLPKDNPDPMAGMDHSTVNMTTASVSAPAKAYEGAMASMMKGMMVPLTGKPDVDFMQGMMPHTKGQSTWPRRCCNTARTLK